MRTAIIVVVAILIIAGGIYAYQLTQSASEPVACTLDAKLCPDGSYVGRIPPSCEFAECPTLPKITSSLPLNATTSTSTPKATTTPAKSPAAATTTKTTPQTQAAQPAQTASTAPASAGPSAPATTTASAPAVVTYTNDGFTPAIITVREGDAVTFKNNSNTSMWVASNPHPQHTDYPGFDEHASVAKGGTWSFTFKNLGSWGYHNHASPGDEGTIVVQ